KKVKFYLRLLI
ncbi:hypothetical protein CP8484711_0850B, partial [Chlamydia psittaci 84-8471/1]